MGWATWRGISRVAAVLIAAAVSSTPAAAQTRASEPAPVTRLTLRVTNAPTDPAVRGILAAVDGRGQAVPDVATRGLHATLDGQPATLQIAPDRPSIAVAVGLLLDSSANATVRSDLGAAVANGLQGIDTLRDVVAIASTAERRSWERASFTNSADDLRLNLDTFVQNPPQDDLLSLDQVAGLERALAGQAQEVKALLLVTNRTPASAATPAINIAVLRGMAIDDHLQISILVLPQAGGQGVAEALAEATPGGGVEYVLNATNQPDLTQRVSSLLAPALGALRFSLPMPTEGSHTLNLTATGLPSRAQATFIVSGRAVGIAAIEANGTPLQPGSQIDRPTWLTVRPAADAPLEGVDWGVDGHPTQASVDPFALLVDPDQTGDGGHEITARAISQGRIGPLATTTVFVPFDAARQFRRGLHDWGLLAIVLLGNGLLALVLVRRLTSRRGAEATAGPPRDEFPPLLRLKQRPGAYVAPEVIDFPKRGKLRIGYHPPFMDNHVGAPEFQRLPFRDVRGDDDLVRDLSRHAACIWREPETNDCFVQLGWPGPGEQVYPKPQAQVLHFGKPQEATNSAYRLAHQDVIHLSSRVEYVFNQLLLRDKLTPERMKPEASEGAEPEASLSARVAELAGRFRDDDEAEPGVREEP